MKDKIKSKCKYLKGNRCDDGDICDVWSNANNRSNIEDWDLCDKYEECK